MRKLTLEESKSKILKKYHAPEDFERAFSPSKFIFVEIFFKDNTTEKVVMSNTQRNYFFKSVLSIHAWAIGGLGYAINKNFLN